MANFDKDYGKDNKNETMQAGQTSRSSGNNVEAGRQQDNKGKMQGKETDKTEKETESDANQ